VVSRWTCVTRESRRGVSEIEVFALMAGVEVKRKDKGRVNQKRYEQALRRAEKLAKKYP